ncbi:MAG TPA: hypothetical protein DCM86_08210 [Verrucomicrobiales bacterium]|nr:hypothetical protein [Verrucomicrobiales bacterium]
MRTIPRNPLHLLRDASLGALLSASILLPAGAASTPPSRVEPNGTLRLRVTGMHCDGCARGIASELRRTPGVASAEVTLTNALAVIQYDTNKISGDRLSRVIRDAGYQAKPEPAKP